MNSGKRTRIPTKKAVESELDLSQIIIKNEAPDPTEESISAIPITVSEEATATIVTVEPIAGSPEKIVKVDESDKELPELQIAEDTPAQADIKDKENKKPGVKVWTNL